MLVSRLRKILNCQRRSQMHWKAFGVIEYRPSRSFNREQKIVILFARSTSIRSQGLIRFVSFRADTISKNALNCVKWKRKQEILLPREILNDIYKLSERFNLESNLTSVCLLEKHNQNQKIVTRQFLPITERPHQIFRVRQKRKEEKKALRERLSFMFESSISP